MPEGVEAPQPEQSDVQPQKTTESSEFKEPEGLRLKFDINEDHLIAHTLSSMEQDRFSSEDHKEDIVGFQNHAWNISDRCYNRVVGRTPDEVYFAEGGSMEEMTEYFKKLKESNEFGVIKQQTEEYSEFVKNQWDNNYQQVYKDLEELTGLSMNKNVRVLITHPSLKNGQHITGDTIAWGHNEDFKNYSTVYLTHEILHTYLDNSNLNHAIIELIADNEIRSRINQEPYPRDYAGQHEELKPLKDKLMPFWKEYLADQPQSGKRDILAFKEKVGNMPEFQNTVKIES